MHIHKFKKLTVWQRSIQFVSLIYQITSKFPKEEKYGRSGAGSDAEFIRFLRMAQRSAYEVIAALEIAINLNMADRESINGAINEVDQLSAMITGLIKSLKVFGS